MKCPYCQSENAENARLCLICGREMSAVPPPSQGVVFASPPQTSGLATASLILGILSLFFSCLTGIVAVILGIVALVQIGQSQGRLKGSGMAIAGLILPIVTLPLSASLLFPVFAKARERPRYEQCMSNVRQLVLTTQMYMQDHNGQFPGKDTFWAAKKGTATATMSRSPASHRARPVCPVRRTCPCWQIVKHLIICCAPPPISIHGISEKPRSGTPTDTSHYRYRLMFRICR